MFCGSLQGLVFHVQADADNLGNIFVISQTGVPGLHIPQTHVLNTSLILLSDYVLNFIHSFFLHIRISFVFLLFPQLPTVPLGSSETLRAYFHFSVIFRITFLYVQTVRTVRNPHRFITTSSVSRILTFNIKLPGDANWKSLSISVLAKPNFTPFEKLKDQNQAQFLLHIQLFLHITMTWHYFSLNLTNPSEF